MNRRSLLTLAIIAAAIALSTFRDYLFVNLNYQIDALGHPGAVSYAHSRFRAWVQGMDVPDLSRLKWLLALAFASSNLVFAIALARVRFGEHRYRTAIIVAFVLIGAIALLSHALSASVAGLSMVSIKLLHALQYPVVLLLIWAASWLPRR
ncbi:MAG: hypothetical protein IPL52_01120 [Flavobacteriales bacterium]|nr:hypothetical protein [Flavobacteriales bacterium]